MEQRERDIQELCNAVLNCSTNFYDNPNGAYESTCPFCYEMELRGGSLLNGQSHASMNEIRHKQYCAYLIAKDLSTNLL